MEFSASPFQISQSQCHIAVSSLLSFLNFFSALFYLSPRVAHPPRLLLFHPLLLLVFAERAHRCSGIQWKKKKWIFKNKVELCEGKKTEVQPQLEKRQNSFAYFAFYCGRIFKLPVVFSSSFNLPSLFALLFIPRPLSLCFLMSLIIFIKYHLLSLIITS